MAVLIGFLFIGSMPGLVLFLLMFAGIDRLGLAANRRLRLPWRKEESGPMAAPAVGELTARFHGTKRYELDERKTSLLLKDEDGDDAPPRTEVNLDRGFAIIREHGKGHREGGGGAA